LERHHKMEKDLTYFIDLITRYLSGEATPDEMITLSGWLKEKPENQKIFEEYQKTFDAVEETKINSTVDVNDEWKKFSSKIHSSGETKKEAEIIPLETGFTFLPNYFKRVMRIAAIFILVAASAYVLYYYLKSDKPALQHMVAQNGSVESKLPDGTSVTLNTGATLDYPEKFKKNQRTVTLNGEAYFNVTHDASRPFIISAENICVEVLGTSFYVNTNGENGNIEVILTSGKVAVYQKDKPSERTILEPGEKAEFSKTDQKIIKSENEDENYMSFKTKKLVFSDTPLNEIISTLNKVYHSDIKLKSKSIADCHVTVTFDNQSLDAVLNVLKATVDLKIVKSGSSIEISGNDCK
jgi:transmembrane sensor